MLAPRGRTPMHPIEEWAFWERSSGERGDPDNRILPTEPTRCHNCNDLKLPHDLCADLAQWRCRDGWNCIGRKHGKKSVTDEQADARVIKEFEQSKTTRWKIINSSGDGPTIVRRIKNEPTETKLSE